MKIILTREEFDEIVREALFKRFGGKEPLPNVAQGEEMGYKLLGRENIDCDAVQKCETVEIFEIKEKPV